MVVAHFWVVMGKAADSWTDVMRRSQDANEGGGVRRDIKAVGQLLA